MRSSVDAQLVVEQPLDLIDFGDEGRGPDRLIPKRARRNESVGETQPCRVGANERLGHQGHSIDLAQREASTERRRVRSPPLAATVDESGSARHQYESAVVSEHQCGVSKFSIEGEDHTGGRWLELRICIDGSMAEDDHHTVIERQQLREVSSGSPRRGTFDDKD
jgi:hypothetical protein